MSSEKWPKVKEVLDAAVRRKPEERAAYLDEACEGDAEVRREVESLLSSFGRAEGFMESPAIENLGGEITEEMKPFRDGSVVGRYEIVRQLGLGGMGIVYLAKDTSLGRPVAIKLLNQRIERDEANVRRFVKEAKAASALNHPNILVIHEIGEADGRQYIVSEYVAGETLRQILDRGPLGIQRVVSISLQISAALAAAHNVGIIHRDIKPENIIVRADGYVKVLDFGLAKLVGDGSHINLDAGTAELNQTAEGLILGTVSYMSPEQAKGEEVDARTDVFSLGVVMYEMLAGVTPFAADSLPESFSNLLNAEPKPLTAHASKFWPQLEKIVMKALSKEREGRYRTAGVLHRDLVRLRQKSTDVSFVEEREHATAVLGERTGDRDKVTAGSGMRLTADRIRPVLLTPLIAVLFIALAGAGWWYFRNHDTTTAEIGTLAVLPLRSLDSTDVYTGLGIADAIIRKLSVSRDLVVRPTSSISRFMNGGTDTTSAAKELGVEAVLDGTLQASGDRMRVDVRLISATNGTTLWTETFEADAADIPALQEDIARRVAARLKIGQDAARQSPSAATVNHEAYLYYTKAMFQFANARAYFNKDELVGALEQFEHSIQLDPGFALAHAQYGYAYAVKAIHLDGDKTDVDKANELLRRAEKLDPLLPDVHVARSFILNSQYSNWNVAAAIKELRIAQDIDPNAGHNELAELYWHLGLEDQWRREKEQAMRIDPTSDEVKNTFVNELYLAMLTDEGLEADKKYFGRGPDAYYYFQKRMFKEAEPLIEQMYKKDPTEPVALDGMAILRAGQGRHKEAEKYLREMIPRLKNNRTYHHFTYDIAGVYALAGKTDEALNWLRATAAAGFTHYPLFKRDWAFDPIRNDPKFIAFMNDVHEQWERNKREYR